MKAEHILRAPLGETLDQVITSAVQSIDPSVTHKPWSQDSHAALELREFISMCENDVLILKQGLPMFLFIQEYCAISNVEDNNKTSFASRSWIESLCKTFLLFHFGHFGDYENQEFDELQIGKNRPTRIYQFPKN